MYKKAISLLLAGNLIVIIGLLWADAQTASRPASQLSPVLENAAEVAERSPASEDSEGTSGRSLTFEDLEGRSGRNLTFEDSEGRTGQNLTFEDLEGRIGQNLTFEDLEKGAEQQKSLRTVSEQQTSIGMGTAAAAVSGQRIVDYALINKTDQLFLSEEDLETLLRIVEAEAGSEDEDGRLLVANVVLNRVNSESFPETVTEVVFQREHGVNQFSPVANGRYYTVEISELTISAVGRALAGEDISEGALFFASRKYANSNKMRWFDENLTFLFKHGGHEFFK